ncbi:MAG: META domain-containing protein [Chloroflexi bacterium]|nr:META domain-containing protein [Chloroflexota bacterium]
MKINSKRLLGVLIASLLAGCSLLAPAGGSNVNFEGTTWILISYRGNDANTELGSVAIFQNGEVGGFGGCNLYGGKYTLESGNNRIEIVDLVSTLIYCEEPADLMDQEMALVGILSDATRYEVANGRLKIYNSNNEELIFKENQ